MGWIQWGGEHEEADTCALCCKQSIILLKITKSIILLNINHFNNKKIQSVLLKKKITCSKVGSI